MYDSLFPRFVLIIFFINWLIIQIWISFSSRLLTRDGTRGRQPTKFSNSFLFFFLYTNNFSGFVDCCFMNPELKQNDYFSLHSFFLFQGISGLLRLLILIRSNNEQGLVLLKIIYKVMTSYVNVMHTFQRCLVSVYLVVRLSCCNLMLLKIVD